MFRVQLNENINRTVSLNYFLGIWNRNDEATVRNLGMKLFYCVYAALFSISLLAGVLSDDDINQDEAVFSIGVSITCCVTALKVFYVAFEEKQIIKLLNQNCVYSVDNQKDFNLVNKTLKTFEKIFAAVFVGVSVVGFIITVVWSATNGTLFFKIGFPLDWRNNKTVFWIASAFQFALVYSAVYSSLFSAIVWYILVNCVLRYKILEDQIKNLGTPKPNLMLEKGPKILEKENERIFFRDLLAAIDSHQQMRELVQQLESFLSTAFLLQIITSGASICVSVYCLAFNVGQTLTNRSFNIMWLFYNLSDIFIISYIGNEIYLSSNRLTCCLLESNWYDQQQSTTKCVIIFAELLQKPQVLVIGKLYPLTLETFMRILKSAYSMFNILQSFQ